MVKQELITEALMGPELGANGQSHIKTSGFLTFYFHSFALLMTSFVVGVGQRSYIGISIVHRSMRLVVLVPSALMVMRPLVSQLIQIDSSARLTGILFTTFLSSGAGLRVKHAGRPAPLDKNSFFGGYTHDLSM